MVQWFCLISWWLFYGWTSNILMMSQCDTTFDLKINVGHSDLCSTAQWFCLISWRLVDGWVSYFQIMRQYYPTFELKINIGRHDLYFMVQWFCFISWKLFDGKTSYFWIMGHLGTTFDLKINVHSLVILPYILKTIWCMIVIFSDNKSVWLSLWPQNKYRSQWPIFHGLVILLYVLKSI